MNKDTPQEPTGDIPAWFMTYSDVITLLMTFFILLLTFSTTEPERFEKAAMAFFGESGATGVAGHPHDKMDRDSWSQRVRPRSARIAMHGAEMPPMLSETSSAAVGRGLRAVTEEEAQKDIMRAYSFRAPLMQLVGPTGELTRQGLLMAEKLARQLQALPVACTLEISDLQLADQASAFAHNLYHIQGTRPGQTGLGLAEDLDSGWVRFVIERFE